MWDFQEEFQSAYRCNHSTETALLRIKHDFHKSFDSKSGTVLVLLDLKSAFDTVDHAIMLEGLHSNYAISGLALQWFRSYLADRHFSVCVRNETSDKCPLKYGVPQGSVLGPLLFTLYINPIGDIIRRHNVKFHIYADDIQMYYSFDPRSVDSLHNAISVLEKCISEVSQWMVMNKLQLNEGKTEALLLVSPKLKHHLPQQVSVSVGNISIVLSDCVRTLGVEIDASLSMSGQVTALCKSLNFHLYNISRVRKMLTKDACSHAIRSLVLSRLDYSNSLLINVSKMDTGRLQRIQNRAARIVLRARKHDRATPLLKELHWLPVERRISYKVALIVYKCMHKIAPEYLISLLSMPHRSNYSLRSSKDTLYLNIPRVDSKKGEASFDFCGPKTWNNLPYELRSSISIESFKKNLKTYLFSL